MLDFGFSEILLTSAIALVVLGPERLPKVARQVGNWMGRARVMARQLTEQLEREVNAEELLKQREKPATSATPAPATAPTTQSPDSLYPIPLAPVAAAPEPAPVQPPRPLHPNSPAMMHARDAAATPAVSVPPPSSTENSVKPAHE